MIGTLAVYGVGCYIWYSEEGAGRAAASPRPLLAVPNVTAHPSTASVPTSYHSVWLQQYGYWYTGRLWGGMLHLVQRGGGWAGCGPNQTTPRCTKCNCTPINGQCTNFIAFSVVCRAGRFEIRQIFDRLENRAERRGENPRRQIQCKKLSRKWFRVVSLFAVRTARCGFC